MIAVIFEVIPHEGKQEDYLAIAATLRPILEKMEGFLSIERFQSLQEPGKILSLSFWKDEESITRWRKEEMHRAAQQKGRDGLFSDYRLRIAVVSRDYGMHDREQAPADSRQFHTGGGN